jgi:hypothetical protein
MSIAVPPAAGSPSSATAVRDADAGAATERRWGPAHWLALVGVALLAYMAWTLAGWLADGPDEVTTGRDTASSSRVVAWGLTGLLWVLALGVVASVVRESRRLGRLSFDGKLAIGLVCASFWDTFVNWIQPIWFYSANWPLNLNDWWANAPGIVSPAAGEGAFPVLMIVPLYVCFVIEARLIGHLLAALRRRRPAIGTAGLVAAAAGSAVLTSILVSTVMIRPHLWGGPGMPVPITGGDHHWSLFEFGYIVAWATTLGLVRFFVDARGARITERGLGHLPARVRTAVSTLATIAVCCVSVIGWSTPVMLAGLHAEPYPAYPPALPNRTCDTATSSGTAYGPCPGSPGFRMPVRGASDAP